jgi:hypothetical protein
MNQPCLQFLAVLAVLFVSHGGPGHSAEPCRCSRCARLSSAAGPAQIAFSVTDGWVEFTVRQDGEPVSDALVAVFDAHGRKFASGETGTDGRGTFPLPSGPSLAVEIKIIERVADPILLTSVDGALLPSEVLLSFGAKQCCRRPQKENQETSEMTGSLRPIGLWLLSGGSLCLLLSMVAAARAPGSPLRSE